MADDKYKILLRRGKESELDTSLCDEGEPIYLNDVDKIVIKKKDGTFAEFKASDNTKESLSNKVDVINHPSIDYYPSTKGVWDFVETKSKQPLADIEQNKTDIAQLNADVLQNAIKNTTSMTNNVVINDSSDSNIVDLMLQDSSAKVYLYGKNLADFNSYFKNANGWTSGETAEKIVITKDTQNKTVTFNTINESGRSGVNVMWKNSSVDYERLLTKTITISVDVLVTDDCTFFLCNSCDNYKSTTIKLKANEKQRVSVTTTMPSDISKIQNTSILFHIDSTKTNVTLSNFQIELNSVQTDYENFKDSQTVSSSTDLSTVHTYYPTTTVIADSDFVLTYIADTKNYVDAHLAVTHNLFNWDILDGIISYGIHVNKTNDGSYKITGLFTKSSAILKSQKISLNDGTYYVSTNKDKSSTGNVYVVVVITNKDGTTKSYYTDVEGQLFTIDNSVVDTIEVELVTGLTKKTSNDLIYPILCKVEDKDKLILPHRVSQGVSALALQIDKAFENLYNEMFSNTNIKSGTGQLELIGGTSATCYYRYYKVGRIVTMMFLFKTNNDNTSYASFSGLPFIPSSIRSTEVIYLNGASYINDVMFKWTLSGTGNGQLNIKSSTVLPNATGSFSVTFITN